jgi:hypothetical protein
MGAVLYDAVARPDPVASLLRAYRTMALSNPNLYRLSTSGPLPRERLAPGLEEWSGTPFFLATNDPHRAQALWSFAHGMVILELRAHLDLGAGSPRVFHPLIGPRSLIDRGWMACRRRGVRPSGGRGTTAVSWGSRWWGRGVHLRDHEMCS